MVENDQESIKERVEALELRVNEQNDEIASLKTTLLDLIKRVEKLEPPALNKQTKIKKLVPQGSFSKSIAILETQNETNKPLSPCSTKSDPQKSILKTQTKSIEKLSPSLVKPISRLIQSNTEIIFNSETGLVKFFLRGRPITFYLPSTFIDSNFNYNFNIDTKLKVPKQELKLEWVYGYRGKDCRSNLYYLPNGEMIYFIAGIVVLHNLNESTQRFYLGHTDDVKVNSIRNKAFYIFFLFYSD